MDVLRRRDGIVLSFLTGKTLTPGALGAWIQEPVYCGRFACTEAPELIGLCRWLRSDTGHSGDNLSPRHICCRRFVDYGCGPDFGEEKKQIEKPGNSWKRRSDTDIVQYVPVELESV